MTTLLLCLAVIIVPGVVTLLLVKKMGSFPGFIILFGMILWGVTTWATARNPGNVAIAPEIFGGQTIAYSQRLGLREAAFAILVLAPATLWVAIALLIGRVAYARAEVPK